MNLIEHSYPFGDIYLKVAERLDLKCSHHKGEMIIMTSAHDAGVSSNHIAIYKYTASTCVTL